MTLPQVTSWVFLAAIAVMFNVLMQPRSAAPRAATPPVNAPAVSTESATLAAAAHALIVPVAQVAPDALTDTWGQARSEGRSHQGVDILAPRGTPVLAAVDGRIVKFFDSVRGGITI